MTVRVPRACPLNVRRPVRASLLLAFALPLAAQTALPGDAQNGAAIFKSEGCVNCHSVNGEGGKGAPDLGKRTAREYSPAMMAGLMWNHAPAMWSAIEKQGGAKPALDEQKAADLFAYFFAARYFERPGDASRGRKLFVEKSCADCHSVSSSTPGGGPPVIKWESLGDPIELAHQMWNHSAPMRAALEKKKMKWPSISSQELTDILVYLQHLPQTKNLAAKFSPASAQTGETLFRVKGCVECHRDKNSLERRFGQRTMTDFAAAMWNHAPQMLQTPPSLSGDEMRRIVGYLWSVQFFDERGSDVRGKAVFTRKQCAGCHGDNLKRSTPRSSFSMVAALWQHGPAMLAQMKQKNVAWPRFNGTEMPDVIAYLNALK
jgi:cytochrome c551/c552